MKDSQSERDRAYKRFESIYSVHDAAIRAFRVLATIDDGSGAIAMDIRLRLGMSPKISQDVAESAAENVLAAIEKEHARNFAFIRGSALIAICGAFEYLLKAAYVDQAQLDPVEASHRLRSAKLRISAAEAVGATPIELWFRIANRLYEALAEGNPTPSERISNFVIQQMRLTASEREVLERSLNDASLRKAIDEAFLTRNCLVHNGGRASRQLCRVTQWKDGEEIVLPPSLSQWLRPMRGLAGEIAHLGVLAHL